MDPLLLLLFFLGGGKRKPAGGLSTSPSASPRESPPLVPTLSSTSGGDSFSTAWRKRCAELMARTKGGERWVTAMSAVLGAAAGPAAGRWIGIESGGRPVVSSSLNERGLAQVMEKTAKELGVTPEDWAAMADPKTPDARHALIAARVIAGEVAITGKAYNCPDPGWGPAVSPKWGNLTSKNGIGAGKLRHGLPLLMREMNEQGVLKPTISETIYRARKAFQPSPRLAAFAGGKHAVTKLPTGDLLLRFLASAAVVALGEEAASLADRGGDA